MTCLSVSESLGVPFFLDREKFPCSTLVNIHLHACSVCALSCSFSYQSMIYKSTFYKSSPVQSNLLLQYAIVYVFYKSSLRFLEIKFTFI